MNELRFDINSLLGQKTDCDCGKIHTCNMEKVLIRNGALNELPALCKNYNSIAIVCDKNTRRVCGERALALLGDKVTSSLTFECDGFVVPDEDAVARINSIVSDSTDLIVGVGSGVINDLCKYVSFEHGLPYYIVATAPSMDGYASKGCAMIFGGMKVTTNANPPTAIIADTSVIKDAPLEMLKAGYGDIIGKYSCLNDWLLSNVVNGEPVCEYIYDLTYNTVTSIAGKGKDILSRDEQSIAELMHALVLVGIAMAYMGNSRPASGSEHHLSHYYEVVGLLRNEPYFCHGIDVAYSTYETAKIREQLLKIEKPEGVEFNESLWEQELVRVYGKDNDRTTADGIIALQKKLGWIYEDKTPVYVEKWDEIRKLLSESPSLREVMNMLESIELPISDYEATYSEKKRADALLYAKDLKDRYSVLWLYFQIK